MLDPLSRREIGDLGRRWQTHLGRLLYVALTGLVVYEFWRSMAPTGVMPTSSEYADLSRRMFGPFVVAQMILVTLGSVVAAAEGVAREMRAGTLGLLLLTPLTPRQVAWAKWKGAMAHALSLLMCGIPVVAVCVFLGGVGPVDLAWSALVTLGGAAMGAGFSLLSAAKGASPARATMISVAWFLGSLAVPFVVLFPLAPVIPLILPFAHPVAALFAALALDGGPGSAWGLAALPLCSSLIVAGFFVRAAAKHIGRLAGEPAPAWRMRGDFSSLDGWYAGFRSTGRFRKGVWQDRALLWKELATRAAGRVGRDFKQLTVIYLVIIILAAWAATMGRSLAMFCVLGALFLGLAVMNGISLFSTDLERRRLETLLSTPVTAGEIVRAKLAAGLAAPEALLAAAIWIVVAVGWSWWTGPAGMLLTVLVSGAFLVFATMVGAFAGLIAGSMRAAVLLAGAVLTLILVGLPFFASLAWSPDDPSGAGSVVGTLNRVLHPVVVLGRVGEEALPAVVSWFVYAALVSLGVGAMPALLRRVTGRA